MYGKLPAEGLELMLPDLPIRCGVRTHDPYSGGLQLKLLPHGQETQILVKQNLT